MLQAVKQSTLGARDLSCAVFGFGQVFVGSGTPTLSFIAPQNSIQKFQYKNISKIFTRHVFL